MSLQMWSLLVLLTILILILWVVLPATVSVDPVVAETIIMSKPAKYCEISLNAGAWTGEPSRSAPFLVEKMAIQAGASATVALALGNAYRNCNPNELPAEVFIGVIKTESNFNPKDVSYAGAKGIMQLSPSTFRIYLKAYPSLFSKGDIFDPYENACAGLLYLNDNYEAWVGHVKDRSKAIDLAVASYLTGVTKLKNSGYSGRIYDGNNYVSNYLNKVKTYARSAMQATAR